MGNIGDIKLSDSVDLLQDMFNKNYSTLISTDFEEHTKNLDDAILYADVLGYDLSRECVEQDSMEELDMSEYIKKSVVKCKIDTLLFCCTTVEEFVTLLKEYKTALGG